MTTHECRVLIVDDAVTTAALPTFPSGVTARVVNDIAGALDGLGVNPNCQEDIPVGSIAHNYDIVLLDFRLRDEDMKDYPMGGLTLHSLFKAAFVTSKRGQCIVCCYSDKMAQEYPKARYVFELAERKLRNQETQSGLHQSGIGGIKWPELFQAKADSILAQAPFSVFAEIAGHLGTPNCWDKPLLQLARFLSVDHCTLNQFLFRSGRPESELNYWLKKWLWRRSLCRSTFWAYKEVPHFAHTPTATDRKYRKTDVDILYPAPSAVGELPSIGGYSIPRELAEELEAIGRDHLCIPDSQYDAPKSLDRCARAKKAFRMTLKKDDHDGGYTLDDLLAVDQLGECFAFRVEPLPVALGMPNANVRVYVHRRILATLLRGLQGAVLNHGPLTISSGQLICNVKVPEGVAKTVLFSVKQKDPILSSDAVAIAEVLANGKRWGPFPSIASWGAVWIGCEGGAVFGVSPSFAFNLGLDTPVLQQGEIAIVLPYERA